MKGEGGHKYNDGDSDKWLSDTSDLVTLVKYLNTKLHDPVYFIINTHIMRIIEHVLGNQYQRKF